MLRFMRWCVIMLAMACTVQSDTVQMRPADSQAIIAARADFYSIVAAWEPYLNARGIDSQSVAPYFITPQTTEQPCGRYKLRFASRNATACQEGANYHVLIPVRYIALLYGGEYGKGWARKVPARALLAHEYGHIVQFMLAQRFGLQFPGKIYREQLSDCLAGATINKLYGFKWTLPGTAVMTRWYATIGDPAGVRSHGSGRERHNAFDFGYGVGMSGTTYCFQKFWPNVMGL